MTWFMTGSGMIQAPDENTKNEMMALLKRLDIDTSRLDSVTFDKRDTGFTISVEYKQPRLEH